MKNKIIWSILRTITVILFCPFFIMKLIGDLMDDILEKIMDWEDETFGYGW